MFSDSHAHISMILQQNGGDFSFLREIKDKKYRFLMDIGTKPGDLAERRAIFYKLKKQEFPDCLYFAAGLWPHAESIASPKKAMNALEADIETLISEGAAFCAIGECGLDRYRNGIGAEGVKKGGKEGTADTEGEEYLFEAQLQLAKKKKLSVIVHSRSAEAETLKCIDKIGYHRGVIHCFSYGLKEVRQFTERGWYISFPGTVTYAKKETDKQKIAEIIRSVPQEKLLLETDAPYLAPRPFRGKLNTPLLIEYTYAAVSEMLEMPIEALAEQVYENCKNCFKADL